jgi:hypothetical protein
MADIARSDAMVAPINGNDSTWADTEHSSAAAGWNTAGIELAPDGPQRWRPKPVLFWRVPGWTPDHDPMHQGGAAWAVKAGMAEDLPASFDDAVARAIEILRASGAR